jgi:hypothetical protein
MTTKMIYVRLLNEGTEVSRPTQAEDLGNGFFKLLPTSDYNPEDEAWEFLPGSVVKVKKKNDKSDMLIATKA